MCSATPAVHLCSAILVAAVLGGGIGSRALAEDFPSGTQFTPLAASLLTEPMPVEGTDGVLHLAYELLLTNTTPIDADVTTVQISDARTHQVLLTLSGPTLTANMDRLLAGIVSSPSTTIGGSSVGIVWLDVRVGSRARVPRALEHRVVANLGGTESDAIVARIPINRRAAIVLDPPVSAGTWLASEGCCSDDTHHRRGVAPVNGELLVPQRFAVDWFAVDDQHRTWIGDPAVLGSYLSYGRRVLAAASGTVVDSQDGLSDQHPPEPPPVPAIEDTVGNHVTIKVRPGLFLLYAHLQPGSVRVRTGQRVRRGRILGLIGNSGNSTTPHLHFQVLTTPTFFPTDSTPFRFARFDLVGQLTERIWDDNLGLQPTGLLPIAPAQDPGVRRREMPLDRNVIVFR